MAAQTCAYCAGPVPAGARFCPTCGRQIPQAAQVAERKLVTILFADITGSTALGEQLDPERLRALLQRYFSVMSSTIEAWGGTIEKFIGDAVVAVFGVPLIREDDAARALQAALEMLDRLNELNDDFQRQHGVTLRVRIGINTGEVVAGPDHLVVSGDAVNVAARLEQAAEPGSILVGERTHAATAKLFVFEPVSELELKGRTARVPAYRLVRPVAEGTEPRRGASVPIIGRDRELAMLAGLVTQVTASGRPRMALIYGPAGIGKSRLVREFVQFAMAQRSQVTLLQGRCPAVGRGITYWALGEMLRQLCGFGLDDPIVDAQERLRARVRDVLGGSLPEAEIERTTFALATTAGIALPGNPLDNMRPLAVGNELAVAWPRFVSALATGGPVIFLVEDLHWAGSQLLAMLERLVDRTSGPVVIVATARPEFAEAHPQFGSGRDEVSTSWLQPLSPQDSQTMLDELAGSAGIGTELSAELVSTAEGNPFFLEEIFQRLAETDALRTDRHQTRATGAAPLVPDTVHAVLAARIDALPPFEKRVLQEAAVVGRSFWDEPIARAVKDASLGEALLALETRGLIFARPTSSLAGEVEFMFKHALVRDVAYASLPRARRARAHGDVGLWIEERAGDRFDEVAELVAHHYRSAVTGEDADLAWLEDRDTLTILRKKAVEALLVAGAAARRRNAIDTALELHHQALALASSDDERARAYEALGDDHDAAFHGDEAVPNWQLALAIRRGESSGDADRVRLCFKAARMSAIRWGGFKVPPDPAVIDGYIKEGLDARPDPLSRGWLLALFGHTGSRWASTGKPDPIGLAERIRATEEGLRFGEDLGKVDLEIQALRSLSGLHLLKGSFKEAAVLARRELALVDQVAASRERAIALLQIGQRLMDLEGDCEAALDLGRRCYAIGKELSAHEVMHATFLLIDANYRLGRWSEIPALLDEHLTAFRTETDMSCPYVRSGPVIGAVFLAHRGQRDQARETASVVKRKTAEAEEPITPGTPEAWLGMCEVALGNAVEGRRLAEQVLATGRGVTLEGGPFEQLTILEALTALEDWESLRERLPPARRLVEAILMLGPACDRAEGLMAAATGEKARANQLLERAVEGFERLGIPFEAARTVERLAGVVPPGQAAVMRQKALALYEQLGASPHAQRIRADVATTAV